MFLVSDENIGVESNHYIVRAIIEDSEGQEWEEDITLVWVKPTGKLDAMHHTLTHGTCYVATADNEHDAVAQWLEHSIENDKVTVEYSDASLYKSFNLIET